jgi:exodeoxyribonuclease-5
MEWTTKQQQALISVKRWLDSGGEGVYRLFGYAGTGKTTLAKHFAEGLDAGSVLYAAFTGKAAYVLQQKGCFGATTLHSLIYKPQDKSRARLTDLRKALDHIEAALKEKGMPEDKWRFDTQWKQFNDMYKAEEQNVKRMSFALNTESAVATCKLLIVDECSMVDGRMAEDLATYKKPILVLGDPFQLPPVFGTGVYTNAAPDFLLTEVRRQEADSPVLRIATDIREGRPITKGAYGSSRIIDTKSVDKDEVMAFDQVLVGTNKRRYGTNARMRELLGRSTPLPVATDKLVCLRNNHEQGLLNGGLWNVVTAVNTDDTSVDLDIESDDGKLRVVTQAHAQYFQGGEPAFWDIKDKDSFDYGYALTVHKSQGSQWKKVYIFDESRVFRQEARRWLYTAVTRAAEDVVIVQD